MQKQFPSVIQIQNKKFENYDSFLTISLELIRFNLLKISV